MLHCWAASLLGCFTARLFHCHASLLLGCFTAGLFHCWGASLLGCFAAGLFHCRGASLPDCFIARYLHCRAADSQVHRSLWVSWQFFHHFLERRPKWKKSFSRQKPNFKFQTGFISVERNFQVSSIFLLLSWRSDFCSFVVIEKYQHSTETS